VSLLVPMSLLAGPRVLLSSACPRFDLRPEPELAAALPQVHDRSGHVRVAVLVGADAVRLAQPQIPARCSAFFNRINLLIGAL
jgi:hypothetical protein